MDLGAVAVSSCRTATHVAVVQAKNDPVGVLYVHRRVIFCDCNEEFGHFHRATCHMGKSCYIHPIVTK